MLAQLEVEILTKIRFGAAILIMAASDSEIHLFLFQRQKILFVGTF